MVNLKNELKENWPIPFIDMLKLTLEAKSHSSQHNQMLYTFGFILRFLSALFASYYLKNNNTSDCRINNYIITDMRRPSFGNLLMFIRVCCQSEIIDWGGLKILKDSILSLLKAKNLGMPTVNKDTPLLDAMISYRNKLAHGGAILDEKTYLTHIPILAEHLGYILKHLESLKTYRYQYDKTLTVLTGEEMIRMMPLSTSDNDQILGFMEGYDSRNETLRYVSAKRDWALKEEWQLWKSLLQKYGLMPVSYEEFDENWLMERVRSIKPKILQKPENFIIDQKYYDELLLATDTNSLLKTNDPYLAAMIYFEFSGRYCFLITKEDDLWNVDPYEGISILAGIYPNINQIPFGHQAEKLIDNISLIFIPDNHHDESIPWQYLQNDFPNLSIMVFKPRSSGEMGYDFDNEIYKDYFNAYSETLTAKSTWDLFLNFSRGENISLKKIWLFGNNEMLFKKSHQHPIVLWNEIMKNAAGKTVGNQDIEEFYTICYDKDIQTQTKKYQLLKETGFLVINSEGRDIFSFPEARAGLYLFTLLNSKGRQLLRIANNPPEMCMEIAEALEMATHRSQEPIIFNKKSAGNILLTAYYIIKNEGIEKDSLFLPDTDEIKPVAICLVNLGFPRLVDVIIQAYKDKYYSDKRTYDKNDLELASMLRTHGSPELAMEYFIRLEKQDGIIGLQAWHQLAGIYRDRGIGDDRVKAAELYQRILECEDIPVEQLVRSYCGYAENLYLQYDPASVKILTDLLDRFDHLEIRLKLMIYHRIAAAYNYLGDYLNAHQWSQRIITNHDKITGSFAAKCYDTHARILAHINRYEEAADYNLASVKIKRLLGDRRGLQISLLFQSTIYGYFDNGKAEKFACEALALAESINDVQGQIYAHQRLRTVFRKSPEQKAYHQSKISSLENDL